MSADKEVTHRATLANPIDTEKVRVRAGLREVQRDKRTAAAITSPVTAVEGADDSSSDVLSSVVTRRRNRSSYSRPEKGAVMNLCN